ncbi:MAG: TetR/AcrR family transcriptional regulator [Treponema sp.]|nr:TetR/AcrR family transcriptional regulator [Treponema sp.]
MGIQERREREKTERRMTILNCAKELILAQGVERLSMDGIARKAELSKATLYLYFSGKEVILNEICEESARIFLEHFKPFLETGITGVKALLHFWRGYVKQFGNSDEIIIIFRVRNFLYPGQPFVSLQKQKHSKSPFLETILTTMKTIIDQCKAEGIFDPNLDSEMATRLLLSMFSSSVDNAARMSGESKKTKLLLDEMRKTFQVIINGFAREGIDRSCLDISSPSADGRAG